MVAPLRRGKKTETTILDDRHVVPLRVDTESASRDEYVLAERLLDRAIPPDVVPERLIDDWAASSAKLRSAD